MTKKHPFDLHIIQAYSSLPKEVFITLLIFLYSKNERWVKSDQKSQGKETVL